MTTSICTLSGKALIGRLPEQSTLTQILAAARHGSGSDLMLWGEPGIGKTELLEFAVSAAEDFQVLRCRGSRSESGMAFAGLHELLWPAVSRIERLPEPQANALRAAFGMTEQATDRFLVGVAVLNLLADLADERPVLIVADDAHSLDLASAECLAFVARRCGDESIAVLLADHLGPAGGVFDGIPELALTGLDAAAARQLLEESDPDIGSGRADRLIALTAGNPLALRELATIPDAGGTFGPSELEPIPVGPRLRQAFAARLAELSADARTVLLAVAIGDGCGTEVVNLALAAVGVPESAWVDARACGLLSPDSTRPAVRHPIIGAVVYDTADSGEQRAMHRALAAAHDRRGESDRSAWHLGAAADAPDAEIARMLEEAAAASWARGGSLSAAKLLHRAAVLSTDGDSAAARLARSARASWEGGDLRAARDLLAQAEIRGGPALSARAAGGLAGRIEFLHGNVKEARTLLLRDARMAGDSQARQLEYLALRANWSTSVECEPEVEQALLALPHPEDPNFGAWRLPPAPLAIALGHGRHAFGLYHRVALESRVRGDLSSLSMALSQLATLRLTIGRFDDAAADAAEALRLIEDGGDGTLVAQCLTTLTWLAAMRGDDAAVRELSDRALKIARAQQIRAMVAAIRWYVAVHELAIGDVESAGRQLRGLVTVGDEAEQPLFAALAATDAVEAAVRCGRPGDAAAHVAALERLAERTRTRWSGEALARCRALLTDGPEAEAHFRAALAESGGELRPFQHARTRLCYGEWLRRARRRTDARAQLVAARDTFARLGAVHWVDRCLGELELSGHREPTAARSEDRTLLTTQELRIAKLAATGLTNREIAAQLFISPRTVGHHLSNIFPKLGLSARDELAQIDFDNGMRLTR